MNKILIILLVSLLALTMSDMAQARKNVITFGKNKGQKVETQEQLLNRTLEQNVIVMTDVKVLMQENNKLLKIQNTLIKKQKGSDKNATIKLFRKLISVLEKQNKLLRALKSGDKDDRSAVGTNTSSMPNSMSAQ